MPLIWLLTGCINDSTTKYNLNKYYKDPYSEAALMMGSTYAGVVSSFNSLDACLEMKYQVEQDNLKVGYTNSIFRCEK